jgi:hypothetical protein
MSVATLGSLFLSSTENAAGELGEGMDPKDNCLIAIQSDLKKQVPNLSWQAVEGEIGAKMAEVLNVGLDEVLLAGWQKYRGLQEYADPQKHPPEETSLVPLGKHTIRSSHRPRVDLLIGEVAIGGLRLDVQLALELEGIVLKVHHGKIWDLCAGSCQASGTLKCSLDSRVGTKDLLVLKRQTPKLPLSGTVHLADGLAIPPPASAQSRHSDRQEEARP